MTETVERTMSIRLSVSRDGDIKKTADGVEMPVSGVATVGGRMGSSTFRVQGMEGRGVANPAVMFMDVKGTRVSGPDLGDVHFFSKGEIIAPQKTPEGFLGTGTIIYTDRFNPKGMTVPVTFDVRVDRDGIATAVQTYGHATNFVHPSLRGQIDVGIMMDRVYVRG